MLLTTATLQNMLGNYKNPHTKIERMVQNQDLFPVKRGLYETEKDQYSFLLAEAIYSPSYLSFEFALSYYGLIPEWVPWVTSATYKKRRRKEYVNRYGQFSYQDVPASIYFYGVEEKHYESYPYHLATPEKALCDQLYTICPSCETAQELAVLLVENLRIEEEDLQNLSFPDLQYLSEHYPNKNVRFVYDAIARYI